MLLLQIFWLLEIEDPRIDRLRSGDDIFMSVVTQLGVTRPCVGRDLTVMLGLVLGGSF